METKEFLMFLKLSSVVRRLKAAALLKVTGDGLRAENKLKDMSTHL